MGIGHSLENLPETMDNRDEWWEIVREIYASSTIWWYISSSSSCRAISTDISDPLWPPLPIIHCFWQVFQATSSICTELLHVCSSWTSCLCSSLWRGPQEYIPYELVPTSPAVSCTSGSFNFDSFYDGL